VSETEEEEMEKFPDKVSRLLGISAVETANEVSKDYPKGGVHLQRLARDATICFA